MQEVRCLSCGYDIFTTPPDPATGMWNCPECGRPHSNGELSREAEERSRRAKWWYAYGFPWLLSAAIMLVILALIYWLSLWT